MAKILLLEDDTSLNRGISLKLEKEGYEVLSAVRAAQAEEMFRENEVSLIISDITMEDGDGLEFCRSIRRVSDVHLIFLTALDQEVDIVNATTPEPTTIWPSPYRRASCWPASIRCCAAAG